MKSYIVIQRWISSPSVNNSLWSPVAKNFTGIRAHIHVLYDFNLLRFWSYEIVSCYNRFSTITAKYIGENCSLRFVVCVYRSEVTQHAQGLVAYSYRSKKQVWLCILECQTDILRFPFCSNSSVRMEKTCILFRYCIV